MGFSHIKTAGLSPEIQVAWENKIFSAKDGPKTIWYVFL